MVRPVTLRILGLPGSGKSTAAALLYASLVTRSSATPPVFRYFMEVANLRVASGLFRRAFSTPSGTSVEGEDCFSVSFIDMLNSTRRDPGSEEGIPLRVETQTLSTNTDEAVQALWPPHRAGSSGGPPLVANLWILDSRQLRKPGVELKVIGSVLRSLPEPQKESRKQGALSAEPVNFLLFTRWDLWSDSDLPVEEGQLLPPPPPPDARARKKLLDALMKRVKGNDSETGPVLAIPPYVPVIFSGKSSPGSVTSEGTAFDRFLTPYAADEYAALLSWLAAAVRT